MDMENHSVKFHQGKFHQGKLFLDFDEKDPQNLSTVLLKQLLIKYPVYIGRMFPAYKEREIYSNMRWIRFIIVSKKKEGIEFLQE